MNPDNPNFRTLEEERRAEELVKARERIKELERFRDDYIKCSRDRERLIEIKQELEAAIQEHIKDHRDLLKETNELKAENARLKDALQEILDEPYQVHTDLETGVNYWPAWARDIAKAALEEKEKKGEDRE